MQIIIVFYKWDGLRNTSVSINKENTGQSLARWCATTEKVYRTGSCFYPFWSGFRCQSLRFWLCSTFLVFCLSVKAYPGYSYFIRHYFNGKMERRTRIWFSFAAVQRTQRQIIFACWVILHAFLSSMDFFFYLTFPKRKFFRNIIRVSNSLNPDQARRFVGPDLVQTVCKGYQQTANVAISGERVNCYRHMIKSMDELKISHFQLASLQCFLQVLL